MYNEMNNGFNMIHEILRLKWIPEIIDSVSKNNHKYTDIINSIDYISHTELSRKLLFLQDNSILIKLTPEDMDGYYLTEYGKDLKHIFDHLVDINNKYVVNQ